MLGCDFTGLCQLSTQGVRSSNHRCLRVIAVVRMCLIWRQRQQQFAVSGDLLVRGWEEQLVQKVHDPRRGNRWSRGPRKGRRDGWMWLQNHTEVTGWCGRHKKRMTTWFYWQFPMFSLHVASVWFPSEEDLWRPAVCSSWNKTWNCREGWEGPFIIYMTTNEVLNSIHKNKSLGVAAQTIEN